MFNGNRKLEKKVDKMDADITEAFKYVEEDIAWLVEKIAELQDVVFVEDLLKNKVVKTLKKKNKKNV
jgi:hypothetical protein